MSRSWHGVECEFRTWRVGVPTEPQFHSAPYGYVLRRGCLRTETGAGHVDLDREGFAWCPSATPLRQVAVGEGDAEGWILRFRRNAFAPQVAPDAEGWALCEACERLALRDGPLLPVRPASVAAIRDRSADLAPIWHGAGSHRALRLKAGGLDLLAVLAVDQDLAAALATVGGGGDAVIDDCLRWLDEAHTDEGLTIAVMAERCGLGRSRFCERFRANVGQSPQDHLRRLRIAHACRLLRDTNQRVVEIAFAVGFGSLARFHAAFRQLLGDSPGRWRRG